MPAAFRSMLYAHGCGAWSPDNLDLHMVTSPAFFDDPTCGSDDALSEFAGQYDYLYAKALLFDVEQDSVRTVAVMGDVLRGADHHRCP